MLGASQFMHFLCALPSKRQYGLWSFMSENAKYFIKITIFGTVVPSSCATPYCSIFAALTFRIGIKKIELSYFFEKKSELSYFKKEIMQSNFSLFILLPIWSLTQMTIALCFFYVYYSSVARKLMNLELGSKKLFQAKLPFRGTQR